MAAALAAALATTAGVAACSGGAAPAGLISVSNGGCGSSWHLAAPGWHTFQVHNAAAENAEIDLVNPANGAIYAEVEALGPGTTSPMRLNVGSGSYAFRCLFEDFDPLTGPTVTVGGHSRGSPGDPAGHQRRPDRPVPGVPPLGGRGPGHAGQPDRRGGR